MTDRAASHTQPTGGVKKKRSAMLPREHGAYAQLGFPLLTAILLGGPDPAVLLLSIGIVAAFLLHEPIMVLTGGRGGRAQRMEGERARKRLTILGAVALIAGLAGLWLAPMEARAAALVPAGLALLLLPLTLTRREKTTTGELLVAMTLPSTMIPVAIAGGVSPSTAVIAAAVWAVVFGLGTLTVRAIIARAKKNVRPSWPPALAPILSGLAIAVALALAISGVFPTIAAIAVVPTALVALVFGVLDVHPRNLRRMGWSLVASNIAVLAALIAGLA